MNGFTQLAFTLLRHGRRFYGFWLALQRWLRLLIFDVSGHLLYSVCRLAHTQVTASHLLDFDFSLYGREMGFR
jgi:hypothetical protein